MEQFLRQIESVAMSTLRKTMELVDIGPFCAFFDPLSDLIWLNYATPVETISSQRQFRFAMEDLRSEFSRRQRRLRFEFIQSLWPELGPLLLGAGLHIQAEQPLMVCTAGAFRAWHSPDLYVHRLSATDADAVLEAYQRTAAEGFSGAGAPEISEASRNRLRIELQCKARYAVMGWIDDEPAGVAALSPMGPIAELVGITTLPRFRRRGVASALSSELLADHFARGHDAAWLSAGDSIAQSVYQTIGFSTAGIYANYIAPINQNAS